MGFYNCRASSGILLMFLVTRKQETVPKTKCWNLKRYLKQIECWIIPTKLWNFMKNKLNSNSTFSISH